MYSSSFNRNVCIEVPHHITSIWIPYRRKDVSKTGSRGLGLVVSPKLKMCLFKDSIPEPYTCVREIEFLRSHLNKGNRNIGVKTVLPPGYGYSVSAATLIAYFLLEGYISSRKGFIESLRMAHAAEIEGKSGLGDVLAISYGKGIAFRVKEGSPGIGLVESFHIPSSISILSIYNGRMHTVELLNMYSNKTRRLALSLLRIFENNPGFDKFLEISREFTLKAKMHSFNQDKLIEIESAPGVIGFYAKKSVAVFLVERDMAQDALDKIKTVFQGHKIVRLEPEYNGISISVF
jgi:pantoate kinase